MISDWSSQSSLNYTFVNADNTGSSSLAFWIGVRNNDGNNYYSSGWGDRFTVRSLTIQ